MNDNPKLKLLITRKFPERVMERARANFDTVENSEDAVWTSDDVVERARGCDAIFCSPTEPLKGEAVARLPESVRMIATFSVGYDHLDVAAIRARGILISNTPDVLTEATADVAMLCLLGAARRAKEAMAEVQDGTWGRWIPTGLLGKELSGSRLGLVGFGRIAQATARRALGFGMKVSYWNRRPKDEGDLKGRVAFVPDLDDLFRSSDFISVHAALAEETRKLVNAERIALLPEGAVVVNTARGGLIDDDALIAALKSGRVFAAGLDVFEGEPDLDPRYRELPNVFGLPHIGSATQTTRDNMGLRALANLERFSKNQDLLDPVG